MLALVVLGLASQPRKSLLYYVSISYLMVFSQSYSHGAGLATRQGEAQVGKNCADVAGENIILSEHGFFPSLGA